MTSRICLAVSGLCLLAAGCGDAPPEPTPPAGHRHVQLLHLDGYRSDLTRALLEAGRLPHLESLVARGKVSFEATTVDKSETMKVIPSYLTSQLDTSVAGWWQFDRSAFRFRNYWLEPAEVLSYALGLDSPLDPTIQDFLSSRGKNLVAGMSLVRRGVPFHNYGRAYLEGVDAVASHRYLRQAHATLERFLEIHHRIFDNGEDPPALSVLLLAAADEFSHAYGVTTSQEGEEHCFSRGDESIDDTVFGLLDGNEDRYFSRLRSSSLTRRIEEVCVELPLLGTGRAHPSYVLSMLVLDMEVGRLIETFRSLRYPEGDTLFDRTLFIVFGDHGMVDTPRGMTGGESFVSYLSRRLGLGEQELAIDYWSLPPRLESPDLDPSWQSEEVRALTAEAEVWAASFLEELRALLKDTLHQEYWWLFFLRSLLIDPKVDAAVDPVSEKATGLLRTLYLRSVPDYRDAELSANRDFFDRHVRVVYGGGARNNAEIFLPACSGAGRCSWERRPSHAEILSYRGGALLDALRASDGVDLIFIRKTNERFSGSPLPPRLEIDVRDRANNRSTISVSRDEDTGELVFHYRTDAGSARDPLGYDEWGKGDGSFGTYNEWNDRTVRANLDYVNVVGGVGAYLYSANPAIGDVLVTHAAGWNFGDNLGGHGGVHHGEKTTFMLVSGPGLERGELYAKARFRTTGEGGIAPADGATHVPTLLDVTPTALDWLGYSREDLDAFARDGFADFLDAWIRRQASDIVLNLDGMDSLATAREEAGIDDLSLEPVRARILRLLEFIETEREATLSKIEPRKSLGNVLILQ